MKAWTSEEVARVLACEPPSPPSQAGRFPSVSTDTRTLEAGALFVALTGERFDGHYFLGDALAAGAAAAVVRRGTPPLEGLGFFEVDDPLQAYGRLARARRRKIPGPVVAITGTNGKTSTKELVAAALATRWRVHSTKGNLNNLVGVPLTILEAPDEAEALVVEAGSNLSGEIARLREIIEPSVGVVTNVSEGHLEGFGSLRGVLAEKVSLLNGVPLGIVGGEPPELALEAKRVAQRVVRASLDQSGDFAPDRWRLDSDGRAVLEVRGREIRLGLLGRHQAGNAVLALAVGLEQDLELEEVARALAAVTVPPGRMELINRGELAILNDTYNSNPASLRASLEVAADIQGERRLVVLVGTMLELGAEAPRLHEELAEAVLAAKPVLVGAVGEFARAFGKLQTTLADRLVVADDVETLGRLTASRLVGDELVLLKASRGVGLERALPFLTPESEEPCSTIS
jgi:UDP-N-acetylmuramoyl-tripeptide--D-alanyl-D-alanine ligase